MSDQALKIAVIERHQATGNVGVGFVRGFGLKRGAIASTVAHDSHNIIAVGVDDGSMRTAIEEVVAETGAKPEGGQGFALDVFSDDQQRLARLADRFEQRDQPGDGVVDRFSHRRNGYDVLWRGDNALSKQEARCKLGVVTRCAHRNRYRLRRCASRACRADLDLERLLDRDHVRTAHVRCAVYSVDD